MGDTSGVRALAMYLPQYHPIPENDRWWGAGFTEWRNVARAKPLFPGHYQPHLPGELGFYDLRVSETRAAQAELARDHGIHGFCYYHYWFDGRRLLHRPIDEILASGEPDFPFCLCWANESWTRAWDGSEREILVAQSYSESDDLRHIRWLAAAFADPRYIRVNGRPLFLVYRASRLPDPRRTTDTWRSEAARLGVGEPYLCRVDSFASERAVDPGSQGFDAAMDFQPDWNELGQGSRRSPAWRMVAASRLSARAYVDHQVVDYAAFVRRTLARSAPAYKRYPGVTPMWDNTARRQRGGVILHGSTPALYAAWLANVIEQFTPYGPGEDLVFINAWNEWAEGNHLEPCAKWGRAYLEASRRVLLPGATPSMPAQET